MKIAVTGYASLDHVAMLDGTPGAGCTTTILARPDGAWPRLGGSPAYAAAALVRAGMKAAVPISWVGDDEAGVAYRGQLRALDVGDEGIGVAQGARTPVAVLAYQPDGGCVCLYDPGTSQEPELTRTQRALVAASDWLCITIGPRAATEAALGAMNDDAKLAWVVKHDPRAMPSAFAARIAERADLVICSQAERDFLNQALANGQPKPGLIAIETRGGAGAVLWRGGEQTAVAAAPVKVVDPTGAGDSFAGGVLAAVAGGERDAAAILQAGHEAAGALLATRAIPEKESVRG